MTMVIGALLVARLDLPSLPMAGMREPITVMVKFDSGTVDEMLNRLTVLRAQTLPRPPAPRKRN